MDVSKIGELSKLAQAINAQTEIGINKESDGTYTWTYRCIEVGPFNSEQDAIIGYINWSITTMQEDLDDDDDEDYKEGPPYTDEESTWFW